MTAIDDLLHAIGRTPSADVIGGVAVTIARRAGLDAEALVAPSLLEVADDAVVGDLPVSVELLGSLHEHGQATATRRRRGSHYTPDDVARRLVQVACPGGPVGRVCDPAVGGGAFLLAAADLLARTGLPRAAIVTERLWGADIDPLAVDVTRTALSLWAGAPCPPDRVVVADTLRHPPPWSHRFDLVVGNPPFLSPLARDTAPSAEARQVLRERFGDAFGPYVDSSALFLLVGLGLLEADGHMVLVQPLSFLAARDAGEVRRRLLEQTCLRGLWVATERVFGAAVEVCAPIVERSRRLGPVTRYQGRAVVRAGTAPAPSSPGELASLAAPLVGIPPARPSASTTLGERAEVIAGFRDEYYAIAAATREGGPGPRVVTAGRIGPLRLDPDRRPVRVQRRDYDDPRVDLAVLRRSGAKVAAWADRLLVPKVLVATQTPVIEVVADPDGTLMPLTPVLAVIPAPDLVWEVAGLLSAPSISAWAAAHTLGTGRHRGVIKLAAREVRLLPGLDDPGPWSSVARLARQAQEAAAEDRWRSLLIQTAFGADRILGASAPAVAEWWRRRAGLADPGVGLRRGR